MKLVERLHLACGVVGLKGRVYRLVTWLLPLAITVYGTYNGLIAMRPMFEFVEPCLYNGL